MFLLFSPIIYLSEEKIVRRFKWKKSLIAGLTIIVMNFIYFEFIYKPFEGEYWDGNPIYFVYERIKKWSYYIGIILTVSSLLNLFIKTNKRKAEENALKANRV